MITSYASSGRGMPVKIYEHSGVQTLFMLLFMLLLAAWLAYTALTPVYDDTLGISPGVRVRDIYEVDPEIDSSANYSDTRVRLNTSSVGQPGTEGDFGDLETGLADTTILHPYPFATCFASVMVRR